MDLHGACVRTLMGHNNRIQLLVITDEPYYSDPTSKNGVAHVGEAKNVQACTSVPSPPDAITLKPELALHCARYRPNVVSLKSIIEALMHYEQPQDQVGNVSGGQ